MLVRVLPGNLSRPERLLGQWLEQWPVPGIAVLNCRIPGKDRLHQTDALLVMPSGIMVLEVKGFLKVQDGELLTPPNGRWTVGGQAAAIRSQDHANPAEQARANMFAAKNTIRAAGHNPGFHRATAILISRVSASMQCGTDGRIDYDRGVTVIAVNEQDTDALQRHLLAAAQPAKRPLTLREALQMLDDLGLDDLHFSYPELRAQGFSTSTIPSNSEPAAPHPPAPPAPASPRAAEAAREPQDRFRARPGDLAPAARIPVAAQGPRSRGRRLQLAAALVITMTLAGGGWLLWGTPGQAGEPAGRPAAPAAGLPPAPPPAPPAGNQSPNSPAAQQIPPLTGGSGKVCFPFQPGC